MSRHLRVILSLFATLSFATVSGCASSSAVNRSASRADLSVDDAETIADAYRRRHELRAANPNPLKDPKSLDDVLEVLRLDEIDLFPGAVKYATAEGSPRGKALAAQILIAWGDGQHLLGQLLDRAGHDLEGSRAHLERKQAAGKLDAAEQARLERVRKSIADLEGVERALRLVGNKHIADGMKLAEQVISAAPSDYEGYRVAADFYHLREDWAQFATMEKKIETLKPDSNGLTFLKAEAARDRDHDNSEAKRLLKEAIQRDPKFTRAQVNLLVLQSDLNGAYTEYERLKNINPNHQIVQWMGPVLERNYRDWKELNDRQKNELQDRATPSPQ
jgi:hypothetical protein